MRELCHIKQITGHTCHQLPCFSAVIIGERKTLQVREQIAPHIRLDTCAHHMPDIGHIVIGSCVHNPQHQIEQADSEHQSNCELLHIVHSQVSNIPHHKRQHQLAHTGERCTKEIKQQDSLYFLKYGAKRRIKTLVFICRSILFLLQKHPYVPRWYLNTFFFPVHPGNLHKEFLQILDRFMCIPV